MPSQKRVSAPANRVYKSTTPLQQTKLPGAKKRIKSYGKKSSVRLSKQETLTQMDWVKLQQLQHDEEEEDQDYEEEEVKKHKKKRRKTTGDEPSTTPQFHTQTMSQLGWISNSALGEEDRSLFDVPSSSQFAKLPKHVKKRPVRASAVITVPPQKSPVREMTPQTPHRTMPREIPSSQSPATPLLLCSGGFARGSTVKRKSINTPIPFNTNSKSRGSPIKLPKLEVEDTSYSGIHASQRSRVPLTPSKRSSPTKSVRFVVSQVDDEDETATQSIELESTPYPTSQVSAGKSSRVEILDSDGESEEDEEQNVLLASTGQRKKKDDAGQEAENATELKKAAVEGEEEQAEPESYYGEIGSETQMEAEKILDSPRLSGISPTAEAEGNPAAKTFTEKTRMMESQRLATQYMDLMAPRTANSDIFISIHPQHVTNIVNRTKDHEFRSWSFAPTVCRVWIYETKPVGALKYMAEVSPAKRPGEISDERGIGNAKFNAKTSSSDVAYEILQLYELSDPLPLSKLIANEWMKVAPQRFSWVRPAVLDQLMANLMPPLFHAAGSDVPTSSSTDTQEAEAQLLSTIKQFTQPAPSSQPPSNQFIEPEKEDHAPPSSEHSTPRNKVKMAPPPSQATTVDLSQTQTPRPQSLIEVVWESPTRPVPSSTPLKLPTPLSAGSEYRGPDTLVPYSMASSQLFTKSQLLPQSLLNESVPGPPLFVQDSDDEEELD